MGFHVLFLLGYAELNMLKDYNANYEALTDIVVLILLSIALLFVIVTPVFLIFCWVHYSLDYVREYRSQFSLKKWFLKRKDFLLEAVPEIVWMKYRSTYSKMVGFGFAIIAYSVSSIAYMAQNFTRFEQGLVEYFSFPFKVLKDFTGPKNEDDGLLGMPEVWMEMLYIVVISIIFFLVGYIYGSFLVDFRLRRLKKNSERQKKTHDVQETKFAVKQKAPLTHFSSIE